MPHSGRRPGSTCASNYNSILSQRRGLALAAEGVLIRKVIPNTPADKAQLQVDKLITPVNNSVTTPASYKAMARRVAVEIAVLNSNGHKERETGRPLTPCVTPSATKPSRARTSGSAGRRQAGLPGAGSPPVHARPRPFTDVHSADQRASRPQAESHGVQIIGLHWLLANPQDLQFRPDQAAIRQDTARYLSELARCCRDLGELMVFGSPGQHHVPLGATRRPWTWPSIRSRGRRTASWTRE